MDKFAGNASEPDYNANNPLPAAAALAAIGGIAGLGGSLLSKKQRKHKLRNTLLGATALPAAFLAANKWGPEGVKSKLNDFSGNVYKGYENYIKERLPGSLSNYIGGSTYNTKDYTEDIASASKDIGKMRSDQSNKERETADKSQYTTAIQAAENVRDKKKKQSVPDNITTAQRGELEQAKKDLEDRKGWQEKTRNEDALNIFNANAKGFKGSQKDQYAKWQADVELFGEGKKRLESQLEEAKNDEQEWQRAVDRLQGVIDAANTEFTDKTQQKEKAIQDLTAELNTAKALRDKYIILGGLGRSQAYNDERDARLQGNKEYQEYGDLYNMKDPIAVAEKVNAMGLGGNKIQDLIEANTALKGYDEHMKNYFDPKKDLDAFKNYMASKEETAKSNFYKDYTDNPSEDLKKELIEKMTAGQRRLTRDEAIQALWEEALNTPGYRAKIGLDPETNRNQLISSHTRLLKDNKENIKKRDDALKAIRNYADARRTQLSAGVTEALEKELQDAYNVITEHTKTIAQKSKERVNRRDTSKEENELKTQARPRLERAQEDISALQRRLDSYANPWDYLSNYTDLTDEWTKAVNEDAARDAAANEEEYARVIAPIISDIERIKNEWQSENNKNAEDEFTETKGRLDSTESSRVSNLQQEIAQLTNKINNLKNTTIPNYQARQDDRARALNRQNAALAATGGGAGAIILLSALNKLRKRKQKEISPEEYINYLEEEGMA